VVEASNKDSDLDLKLFAAAGKGNGFAVSRLEATKGFDSDGARITASKATDLEGQANVFKKRSSVAKQTVKRKYHKMLFIQWMLILGIAALIAMILWAILSRVER